MKAAKADITALLINVNSAIKAGYPERQIIAEVETSVVKLHDALEGILNSESDYVDSIYDSVFGFRTTVYNIIEEEESLEHCIDTMRKNCPQHADAYPYVERIADIWKAIVYDSSDPAYFNA